MGILKLVYFDNEKSNMYQFNNPDKSGLLTDKSTNLTKIIQNRIKMSYNSYGEFKSLILLNQIRG